MINWAQKYDTKAKISKENTSITLHLFTLIKYLLISAVIKRKTMRFIYFIIAISLLGCDRDKCTNTNPVFDKYPLESSEYREELVKQVETYGKDKIDYWIDGYVTAEDKEYMRVYMQNDKLCAKALLEITGNKNLENYRRVKGVSYNGAGLKGLHYQIGKDSTGYHFLFQDVDWIAD
jgi:hypothetical protein